MLQSRLSLTLTWVTLLGLFTLAGSGTVTGMGLLGLLVLALALPALFLKAGTQQPVPHAVGASDRARLEYAREGGGAPSQRTGRRTTLGTAWHWVLHPLGGD